MLPNASELRLKNKLSSINIMFVDGVASNISGAYKSVENKSNAMLYYTMQIMSQRDLHGKSFFHTGRRQK